MSTAVYTPKEGTRRRQLLDECERFEEPFRAGDLADWAERKLGWSPKVVRQEMRILSEKGRLTRVARGLYDNALNGNGEALVPAPVQQIAARVATLDGLAIEGDRFEAVMAATGLVSEALAPLAPNERAGVVQLLNAATGGVTV